MKKFLALAAFGIGLLFAQTTDVKAQRQITNVTKVTCTTALGGNVILEDTVNKFARSYPKASITTSTIKFSGGIFSITDLTSGKTIFQGPVAPIKFPAGYTTDSTKILFVRQYFTNAN